MTTNYSKAACAGMTQKLADGGTVGLWERLKAGNIDKEGSEANMRWGSGSKAAAAAPSDAPAPAPSTREVEPASAPANPPSKADTEFSDYGDAAPSSQTTKSTAEPAPAPAPKRRTASAPAKSKTAADDASPSAAPSKARGNDSRRDVAPAQGAKYQASANDGDQAEPKPYSASNPFVPGKSMFEKVGDTFRSFDQSMGQSPRSGHTKAFVNGGLIGANTANTVTPVSSAQSPNSAWSENARGGGRANYGKK